MQKVFFIVITLMMFTFIDVSGQFTDRYWCFGDSSGIDFSNLSNPVPGHSILRARGTCASICDSSGDLLFYSGSPDTHLWQTAGQYDFGLVLSKNHLLMQNGDSLASLLWYQEMIIVPNPGNSNQFYLFTAGVTVLSGFYYSVIDMSFNNGFGKVVQKNIQLQNFAVNDGLAAVKHGNGRDWWVVMKKYSSTSALDEFYIYLISPSGISAPSIQHIGYPIVNGGFLRLKFSNDGSKLFAIAPNNLIESYNFDRCSGIISNVNTIHINNISPPYKNYWSFALSPDATKLYASTAFNGPQQDSSYLFQYDLTAANILGSVDTLQSLHSPVLAGLLQLGPNGKIYFSCNYNAPDCGFDYLYCDTTWNSVNTNLSVINYPDSLGAACNFQPFSFNLGGHRTYFGLPNNPNYELKADSGSVCDTLHTGLQEFVKSKSALFVNYDSPWQKLFVNAQKLQGRHSNLSIYDVAGREIFNESRQLDSEFYTRDLEISGYSPGLYIVNLTTEKEKLIKKFVKN